MAISDREFYASHGFEYDLEKFEHYAKTHNIEIMTKELYEQRLKADMVDIMKDLSLELQELEVWDTNEDNQDLVLCDDVDDLIHEKINALKENTDGEQS